MTTNKLSMIGNTMLAAALAMTGGCAAQADADVVARRDDGDGQLEARLAELEERAALGDLVACYGRGHDAIFAHLGGDQREALALLRRCFAESVTTQITFFDAAQPAMTLTSLPQLIQFIENNAIASHYRSARNVPGDIEITRLGPGRARVTSATAAPHFLRSDDADPAAPARVDLITARYVHDAARGRDGVWRTQAFALQIDELWRGTGVAPLPR